MKKLLVSGAERLSTVEELGFLALRVFAGAAMVAAHGLNKIPPSEGFIGAVGGMGFPFPTFFAWSAGIAESLGAALLVLGLMTRPSALMLTITMAVAAFIRHGNDPFQKQEMALLYFFIFLLFTLTGSGKWSVDGMIRR